MKFLSFVHIPHHTSNPFLGTSGIISEYLYLKHPHLAPSETIGSELGNGC